MTVIYVFPGQGSHRIGMGADLFDSYPHLVRQADAAVGYSVRDLCLSGPPERLADTRYTQCALYVVDVLSYLDRVRTTGEIPDLVAGHSLGEYVALFAAGAFDFLTGLEIVQKRAGLMSEAGPGAMAAVIGPAPDEVRQALERHGAASVDIANFNSPTQTVISGRPPDVKAVIPVLGEIAETVVPLNVNGAFHSRYMADAAGQLRNFLGRYRLGKLKIPVVSNVSADIHRDDQVPDRLWRHLTEPVRWTESVRYMLGQPSPRFEEIGPGKVLSGLIRQIQGHGAPMARPVTTPDQSSGSAIEERIYG